MRKLARRNKAAFAIGMAIAAALIVAVVALAVSNALVRRESDAKDLALRQKSEALAEKMAALKSARTQEQLAKRHAAAAEEQRQIAAKNAAHAETAREQANQNAAEAKSHEQLARRRLYAAQMELARQAWEKGIPGRVIELLENQRPRFDEEDLRGFEWYYLWGLCRARLRFSFAHPKARAVAISPDGKWLASGGADGVVAVWDLPGRKKFKDLQRRSYGWIYAVTFSPDGTALAAGEANGEVLLWDVATWRQTATLNTDDDSARVMCLAFSPDSKTLAMGGNKFRDMTRRSGGVIKLWDLPAGQLRATLDGHQHAVLSVAFSPSGDALASSSAWSSELKLWDLTSEPPQVAHAESGTGPVAFFPDQKRVAVANSTRVVIRDLATGAELAAGPPGQEQIMSLAVSPDGKQLAIGSDDRTLRFWEPESGRHTLFGHASTIESVAFTPDGASVAAASGDRITLWNTSDAATPQTGLNEYVAGGKASIVYSPDGKALAYATVNGGVKLRDRETLEERILLGSPGGNFEQIEFSHDGKRLAGRRSASMTIWDVDAAREIASLDGSPDSRLLALSPDGRSVTFHNGGQFNALNVWDVDTQTVRTIAGADAPTSMAYTADGKSLVLGTDIRIEVWNTDRWVRERVFRTNNFGVWFFSLSLTPDGKQAIASGKSGWLIALDVQTGKLLNTFKGHIGAVVCTAMFPDGKTLVSGSSDGTIKLWDLATGQERFSWIGHDGHGIVALAVHPGGREIASKGGEGLVRLWRAAQDEDGRAVKTELSADDPGSSAAWINDADALLRNRQFAAAEEAYRRADARLARLAVAFPQERQYTEARAQCLAGIASSLAGSGKPEKAIEYGQQALSLWLHLADDWQDAPLYVEEAAYVAGARLAPWLLQAKQPQAAEEALRRSLHLWDKAGSDAHLFGDDARLTCFQSLIALLNAGGRPDEADEVFRRLLEFEPARASCFNNFAWQLATAPEPRYRDAPRAVTLAKRATKLMDTEGMYWNTLGAAQYRAGEWQAAVEALNKSMKLRAGGDAFDWFFLALAHWRLGDMDEARRWHEQAVRWFEKNGTKNEELIRFRTEADELLATPDTGRSQKAADEHR